MKYEFSNLLEIVSLLRSEHGCAWDKQQTHQSLIPKMQEEMQETIEAIENKDYENLCEELGDMFLHILLHSQIAKENKKFSIEDVIQALSEKLIRRHPHVFGGQKVLNAQEAKALWNQMKKEEKREKSLTKRI